VYREQAINLHVPVRAEPTARYSQIRITTTHEQRTRSPRCKQPGPIVRAVTCAREYPPSPKIRCAVEGKPPLNTTEKKKLRVTRRHGRRPRVVSKLVAASLPLDSSSARSLIPRLIFWTVSCTVSHRTATSEDHQNASPARKAQQPDVSTSSGQRRHRHAAASRSSRSDPERCITKVTAVLD
jgi:hypothetical protein